VRTNNRVFSLAAGVFHEAACLPVSVSLTPHHRLSETTLKHESSDNSAIKVTFRKYKEGLSSFFNDGEAQ